MTSSFDSNFKGPQGASFDQQFEAGAACAFDTIVGLTLFGDGKCQVEQDPGWLELGIMAVSLNQYDPFELNSGQNPATFVSSRDWYLLRFIMVVVGLIVVPEIIIIIFNLL